MIDEDGQRYPFQRSGYQGYETIQSLPTSLEHLSVSSRANYAAHRNWAGVRA